MLARRYVSHTAYSVQLYFFLTLTLHASLLASRIHLSALNGGQRYGVDDIVD